jgi:phosphatidate cytidylyltransferase
VRNVIKNKIWMASIIVPPVLVSIAIGPPDILYLIVLLATFFGLREFYHLALPRSKWIEQFAAIGLGLTLSVIMAYGNGRFVLPSLVLLFVCLSVLFMGTANDLSSTIAKMGITLLGIFYVGFLLAFVSLLRNMTEGRHWVLLLVLTVWAGDISAFLVGSLLGRHKLYPKISPNKTYEGLGGAIFGSVAVALGYALLFIPSLKAGSCILLAIGLGIFGQLGDFAESMLKRSAQVKDSGSLIPGHGGMLDRLDSFLFSAPFFYYSLLYLLEGTL